MNAIEIVERAAGPAIATDGEDRILAWNGAAAELLAYARGFAVAGERFHGLVAARDIHGNRIQPGYLPFYEMVTLGEAPRSYELEVRKASGDYVRIAVSVVVVLGPEPARYEMVYFLREVMRRRRADEAIERVLAQPQGESAFFRSRSAGTRGSGGPPLSRRQLEVLGLLAQGKSNEQIADTLGVSVYTVRRHVQSIFERLEVHSKAEAVARAFRDRLY